MFERLRRCLQRMTHAPRANAAAAEVPPGATLLNGEGDYGFAVAGYANYQDQLEAIYRDGGSDGAERRVIAALLADRGHSYNAHAISVSIRGVKVAHFSRAEGKRYASLIGDAARRGPVLCRASVRVSTGAGTTRELRVFLDLASPGRAVPSSETPD